MVDINKRVQKGQIPPKMQPVESKSPKPKGVKGGAPAGSGPSKPDGYGRKG